MKVSPKPKGIFVCFVTFSSLWTLCNFLPIAPKSDRRNSIATEETQFLRMMPPLEAFRRGSKGRNYIGVFGEILTFDDFIV
jgi:hypothetical protein